MLFEILYNIIPNSNVNDFVVGIFLNLVLLLGLFISSQVHKGRHREQDFRVRKK